MSCSWTILPVDKRYFADIAATEGAMNPEPVSAEQIAESYQYDSTDKTNPTEWFVACGQDGQFVGWGTWGKGGWLSPGERWIYVSVIKDRRGRGAGSAMLRHAEGKCALDGSRVVKTWARGLDVGSHDWLARRGYRVERRRTDSVLDLTRFDAERFKEAISKLSDDGTEIRLLWDEEMTPHLRQLHHVYKESFKDMPSTIDAPELSFESWLNEMETSKSAKFCAAAFHGGRPVGMSLVIMPRSEGQSAAVEFTGVLREFRGRGIALALKVAGAAEARRAGSSSLRTNNDEDNPAILAINERMGFQCVPGPLMFRKDL